MGEVWLAEQLEPVRRKVALKLIKVGMDTKQVVARFESERQALALMDHPAIAKVFDGGSTPEGRPYFVMEYVAGVPLTEHCDTHRLSTRARLALFTEVCEGVQHAHQKAVIHRDLKPSNILVSLVDGKAQPKIIDFGIAKATGYRLTEKTLFTELGVVIGTPEYMSPEQAEASGQDVDTRTDVYSLGVVLYQLLTGELPFASKELRSSSYEELRRKLREVEPPRPSTKLSTLGDEAAETAKSRNTDPGTLRRLLEGDLDAITMKALEKDRARRYGTPSELAQDIGRHLRQEPVVARPPSTTYRLGKYLKRHRVGVALAAGLAALLVAFAASMALQARRTAAQRDRANREREASDKVSAFLANMLSTAKPDALGAALWKDLRQRVATAQKAKGVPSEKVAATLASLDETLGGVSPTETAVHLLDEQILGRAGKTVEQDMGSEPRIAGRLEQTLGLTYLNLGLYPQAEQHAQRAVDIRTRAFGPESPDTLRSMNALALVYLRQGRSSEAAALYQRTVDAERRVLGPEDTDTLKSMNNLAVVSYNQGHYEEAEKLHRETLAARRKVLGPEHRDTIASLNNLAAVYDDTGRYPEAEALYREILEVLRRVSGPENAETLMAMNNLAINQRRQGHYPQAEVLYQTALETERRVLGPEHPQTLSSMNNLAVLYVEQGRYAEAEHLNQETLAAKQKVLGPEHPETLSTLGNLVELYVQQGRSREAETLLGETLNVQRRVWGPEHPDTLRSLSDLGEVYAQQGRTGEAERLLGETLKTQKRVLGLEHPDVLLSMGNLASLYADEGRAEEAEKLAREVVANYQRQKLQDSREMGVARMALGRALLSLRRYAEAEPELLAAERLLQTAKGVDDLRCQQALVALYTAWETSEPGKGYAAKAAPWKAK